MMNVAAQINLWVYRLLFLARARRSSVKPLPIKLNSGSRVLIFSCAGIGDTLTDSVVFKALAETYPGIFLAQVVHERRRALAEHNPYVSKIYRLKKGWIRFYRLYQRLKEDGPWDALLHLRGNDPEPRCLSFLLDAGRTVGITHMSRMNELCGHNLTFADWDEIHGVEQTLRVARYVGADTAEPHLVYQVKEEERVGFEARARRELGFSDGHRIVLQIGGGKRAAWRDWPIDRYVELIMLIKREWPLVNVIILGGRDHLDRRDELKRRLGQLKVVDCVGKLSIEESAALLGSAKVVVSTDTGMMHLAFAVGARVVALIHCNNPASRVGPYGYGDRHRVVELPRPLGYRCPADADMREITAELVFSKVCELMETID
ncbi:MAG: glycosyltransferase family 9 protein [Verrucomicrobiae bacterium]|nr:glycosyltransferase family 9 protein [Verrucomicrobiae bacterium]